MRNTVEQYCRALEQGDFHTAVSLLDPDDVLVFWQSMCDVEKALTELGEKSTTFGILGDPQAPESFRQFEPQELMVGFLKASMGETSGIKCDILTVDEVSPGRGLAVYNVSGFSNTMDLIHRGDRWFVKLRMGMDQLAKTILMKSEDFERRASADQTASKQGDLAKLSLTGYADAQGQTVIEPRFADGEEFSEGLAAVKVVSQWGYINSSAEIVIPAQYMSAQPFSEGVAWVAPFEQEGRLFGLIDKTGKELIPPRFELVEDFSEGLAAVKGESLWGYVNKKGDWVIQPRFSFADSFSEGLAEVGDEEGDYLYIDQQGQPLEGS